MNEHFIEKVANKIATLGLESPAILLLEAHKPLASIGGHLLMVAQPTLNIFLPPHLTQNTINLLEDDHQVEYLIQKLERKRKESSFKWDK